MKKKIITCLFLAAVFTIPFFVTGCTPERESSENTSTSESVGYEENLGDDIFD